MHLQRWASVVKMSVFRVMVYLASAGLGCLPVCVLAAVLQGDVVGVSDGDTVKVLDINRVQHTVRLMGIDAPEKAQPFGQNSKQSLAELVYRQQVHVEWNKKDKYGRIVGKIRTPDGTDVCLAQVRRGMAWHYKQYEAEQSPADRLRYREAEASARLAGLGLWRDQAPVPPWEWRKR